MPLALSGIIQSLFCEDLQCQTRKVSNRYCLYFLPNDDPSDSLLIFYNPLEIIGDYYWRLYMGFLDKASIP